MLDPTDDLPEDGSVCAVTVIAKQISDTDTVDPPDHTATDNSFFLSWKMASSSLNGAGG
jgi:hypothetical protein